MDVHVLAADIFNEIRERPHADAPRVACVAARGDLVVPHHVRLTRDLPEVLFAPKLRRTCLFVHQLRADPMGRVMVALVVPIAVTFTRADGKVT